MIDLPNSVLAVVKVPIHQAATKVAIKVVRNPTVLVVVTATVAVAIKAKATEIVVQAKHKLVSLILLGIETTAQSPQHQQIFLIHIRIQISYKETMLQPRLLMPQDLLTI